MVFSLGMTLLQAASGHECDDLYNYNEKLIHQIKKEERIKSLSKYYSSDLLKLLEGML